MCLISSQHFPIHRTKPFCISAIWRVHSTDFSKRPKWIQTEICPTIVEPTCAIMVMVVCLSSLFEISAAVLATVRGWTASEAPLRSLGLFSRFEAPSTLNNCLPRLRKHHKHGFRTERPPGDWTRPVEGGRFRIPVSSLTTSTEQHSEWDYQSEGLETTSNDRLLDPLKAEKNFRCFKVDFWNSIGRIYHIHFV